MKPFQTSSIILLIAATLAFTGYCGGVKKERIYIAGSSTVLPAVSKAAESFRSTHPEIKVLINSGGSGVGINQVGEGKIQIGMASRDITAAEQKKFSGVDLKIHVIGLDAVVPVVSSEVYEGGVRSLTLEQIGQIYLGKIQNWKELGGPDREIHCIDKEKSRGTRHIFMQAILGDKIANAPGADLVLGSNNEEKTAIVQSDAAIGMLSHAWLDKDVRGLALVLKGKTVEPVLANIKNGSFPLVRDLLLITRGMPDGLTEEFIKFMLSPAGQKNVENVGYIGIQKK